MIPGMDRIGAGAVDRAGCHAWCGKTYAAIPIGCEESRDYLDSRSFDIGTGMRWCSPRCRDLRLPPLAPASPANVSPPSPAPGQRWRGDVIGGPADVGFTILSEETHAWKVKIDRGVGSFIVGKHQFQGNTGFPVRYVGPAAPATPSAVAPAPIPTVAALGSGPPAGYVPCERRGCIRWTYVGGGEVPCCWTCFCGPSPMPATAAQHPDWTPPGATAPAPRPNRTPGVICRRCLTTSAGGVDHRPTCVVMREQGPSAVAAAPGVQRDSFDDLVDEFDLLPDACR